MFLSAKMHNEGRPIRVIPSVKGKWQKCVPMCLQKLLSDLELGDPFSIKISFQVIENVQGLREHKVSFSSDVRDLYYSVPRLRLLQTENSSFTFQNSARISVDAFM